MRTTWPNAVPGIPERWETKEEASAPHGVMTRYSPRRPHTAQSRQLPNNTRWFWGDLALSVVRADDSYCSSLRNNEFRNSALQRKVVRVYFQHGVRSAHPPRTQRAGLAS